MPLLDEISGFEFEDVMAEVFRKRGYKNVQPSRKTADAGRDIIMEEASGTGSPTKVIVECKHTDSVGRPVVQKLDSAVTTYDYDGPKRGMIVTTGRFSGPAREYARKVGIELLDGDDLREIGEEIGMDLYNGKIEILCEKTLNPYHPESLIEPLLEAFDAVRNISRDDISDPETTLTLSPMIVARTHVQRLFETGAGVIHQIDSTSDVTIDASRNGPSFSTEPVQSLVTQYRNETVPIREEQLEQFFDTVNRRRFGETETDYREWLRDREVERHTETITYTGDNNVTYEKECKPNESDVDIRRFEPMYVPRIRATVHLGRYTYPVEWFAAGEATSVTENTVTSCVHCHTGDKMPQWWFSIDGVKHWLAGLSWDKTYTFCENCGSISCPKHIRTERVSDEPICVGCAITDRVAFRTKYFASEASRETFQEKYKEMPIHEKVRENIAGIGAVAFVLLLIMLIVL